MKQKKTYKIALASTMAAISVSLDLFSLKTDTSRYTIYALPLLLAGILYGPIIGGLAGLATGFITQLISYGLTPTTFLWLLAPTSWGLVSGLISKLFKYKYDNYKLVINVAISSLVALFINTVALLLDGLIMKYPTAFVYTNLSIRIITAVFIGIFYSLILIIIVPKLSMQKSISSKNENITSYVEHQDNVINITLKIKK